MLIKKATKEKSMRLVWEDERPVEIYFWDKGASKSQVQIQHRKIGVTGEASPGVLPQRGPTSAGKHEARAPSPAILRP